jgi:acetate kinase
MGDWRTSSGYGLGTALAVNAGSSSIKAGLYAPGGAADPVPLLRAEIERIDTAPRLKAGDADGNIIEDATWTLDGDGGIAATIGRFADWIAGKLDGRTLSVIGHRVVFGGPHHRAPAVIDKALLDRLDGLVPLSPMHMPRNLDCIRAFRMHFPGILQIACFDTGFHRSMPEVAGRYGLPRDYHERGVRRYGFHGLSYEYIRERLRELDPPALAGRTVVAHLGGGASMCAMVDGHSVATTMGFGPLGGLVMGTRPGDLDPDVMLWLAGKADMDHEELERLLYHASGLLGVSGISADMRDLLASDDPHAKQAVELFVYRIVRELGSLAAAAGGLDALVFTGGIGENAAEIRERVCWRSAWLGIRLDPDANRSGRPKISTRDSDVAVWVIPTDEDRIIARHAFAAARQQHVQAQAR